MKVGLPFLGGQTSKRQPKATPTWREMLELRPIRNPELEWKEENERIVLCIKHGERKNWKLRLANLIVPLPPDRRVALDAIGTDVWRMLDGKNTVERIAKSLAKKYKLGPREAELSLQQFFKELGRRGYIGFLKENDK
jgi:hypothetical protein